jgi:hypothetical protein
VRYTELEGECYAANGNAALRATPLTDEQVAIAEAGFKRLERKRLEGRRRGPRLVAETRPAHSLKKRFAAILSVPGTAYLYTRDSSRG